MKNLPDAQEILNFMPGGCILFEDDGSIEFVNQTICELLEYQEDELLNQNVEMIFTVASRIFYQTQFYPLIRLRGGANEVFLSLRSKTGDRIPSMVNAKRVTFNGQTLNLCIFVTVYEGQKHEKELLKINELRQLAVEENEVLNNLKNELELHQQQLDRQVTALKQRNQEYAQLSKVLSHDLREPIRKIGMFTDILLNGKRKAEAEELTGIYQKIQNCFLKLNNMTTSLQRFVYVDSNVEKNDKLDVNDLLQEAKIEALTLLNFESFELETVTIPAIEGQASQIRLLFTELLKNAIQNKKPEQPLRIQIKAVLIEENIYQFNKGKYRYTEHVKIEVTDNGTGFDNQYNSYIFGLLNKMHAASTGAGLGLALCKQIISRHYGTISASSIMGQGTSIVIILPLTQPE
ncbi:ATP-binding protein [Dyadobacter sp. NIV53]|uniref:sensor histidine kinase n=1 Tax=Dyadobacter sp. NIV53 TaxID=2861765 RepID=UPI001C87CEF5|nr:PAS domain-containing sensor histidine kinase [Dyadobacter sp. NIV53]